VKALSAFEDHALEVLRAGPGKKWDDVVTKLKKDPRGTPAAWLKAEKALGE
jgi:hypothetical protein